MKINIKAFWNGSVLSDMDFNEKQWIKIQKQSSDLFKTTTNWEEVIEHLDAYESDLYLEYKKNGKYEISQTDMALNLLSINEIVKKGLRPNDDKYGLLIMKTYK